MVAKSVNIQSFRFLKVMQNFCLRKIQMNDKRLARMHKNKCPRGTTPLFTGFWKVLAGIHYGDTVSVSSHVRLPLSYCPAVSAWEPLMAQPRNLVSMIYITRKSEFYMKAFHSIFRYPLVQMGFNQTRWHESSEVSTGLPSERNNDESIHQHSTGKRRISALTFTRPYNTS